MGEDSLRTESMRADKLFEVIPPPVKFVSGSLFPSKNTASKGASHRLSANSASEICQYKIPSATHNGYISLGANEGGAKPPSAAAYKRTGTHVMSESFTPLGKPPMVSCPCPPMSIVSLCRVIYACSTQFEFQYSVLTSVLLRTWIFRAARIEPYGRLKVRQWRC